MQYVNELFPVTPDVIAKMAEKANIKRVYLHWTAGHYGQVYDDYHISIDSDGSIYLPYNCTDLNVKRNHTYRRNTSSIAIACCGCFDATAEPYDLGTEPITKQQIETMAYLVAVICKHAWLSVGDVLTHCEIAKVDGYGPYSGDAETRWDLWFLQDYDGKWKPGGEIVRGKVVWYMENYNL